MTPYFLISYGMLLLWQTEKRFLSESDWLSHLGYSDSLLFQGSRSQFHGTWSGAAWFKVSAETPSLCSAKRSPPDWVRAPPLSTLLSAPGAWSQRPVLYWNHMEVGRFQQRPPASSLVATCFHFNLIINIWTGISWNWQKEKSQAGINNASTKGK